MRLLFRRDQRSGMLGGKPVFTLDVRADLSAEERSAIKRYGLGPSTLFQRLDEKDMPEGFLAKGAFFARQLEVHVRDLEEGFHFECKDIAEMLVVEDQLKAAAETFVKILKAAASFGGEQVVEVSA